VISKKPDAGIILHIDKYRTNNNLSKCLNTVIAWWGNPTEPSRNRTMNGLRRNEDQSENQQPESKPLRNLQHLSFLSMPF